MSKPKPRATRASRTLIYQQALSEFWEVREFARLASGCDWHAREAELSPTQLKCVRALEASANRSIQGNTLRFRATPREWLHWASERAIRVPPRLRVAVNAYAPLRAPDKLAAPAQTPAEPERAVSAITKERQSMLRLIGGLIERHYGRLEHPFETGRRIAEELAQLDIVLTSDTVAKYIVLADAVRLRAPQKPLAPIEFG